MGDERWSYEGQLAYFKKTERWFKASDAHGQDGKFDIESPSSAGRVFPLHDKMEQAWNELGVRTLPGYDMNAGDNIGVGEFNENRSKGARQIAPFAYPLDGATLLADTLVASIIVEGGGDGTTIPRATGVRLADGREFRAQEVIVSCGAYRTPQLLMLSGIGPAATLRQHGIEVRADIPDVGRGLNDHLMMHLNWRLRDPSRNEVLGSANPIFARPEYAKGVPTSFIVCTTAPEAGLRAAIAKDAAEGIPDPDSGADVDVNHHPLLRRRFALSEHVILHAPLPPLPPDGAHIGSMIMEMKPTSRGTVTIGSRNPADPPVIDPNYLATEVDRFAWRAGLRELLALLASDRTVLGREVIAGEVPPPGCEALTADSPDDALDKRVKDFGS